MPNGEGVWKSIATHALSALVAGTVAVSGAWFSFGRAAVTEERAREITESHAPYVRDKAGIDIDRMLVHTIDARQQEALRTIQANEVRHREFSDRIFQELARHDSEIKNLRERLKAELPDRNAERLERVEAELRAIQQRIKAELPERE